MRAYGATINQKQINHSVLLSGWVHRRRDHGGIIFVDLRDRSGLIQLVFDPEHGPSGVFEAAEQLRHEYVIEVEGRVRLRPEGTENFDLPSGAIEILVDKLLVHNVAEPLPIPLNKEVHEELRLTYRYLDLRRPIMRDRLLMRAQVMRSMRAYLDAQDFTEVETPVLTKATPEGARDYLVPSRTHPGHFFALPQSPQVFKQLLMVAGFERYYQIVRCFRDEDLRADRQPEFTQLDMELSFVDEATVQDIVETMLRALFEEVLNVSLPNPFPRMPYQEAIQRFGTDRPDLRINLELIDIDALVAEVDFAVFSKPAQDPGGRVAVLRIPGGIERLSRKAIDEYTQFVGIYGAKGLAYIKVNDRAQGILGVQSPIVKFLPEVIVEKILDASGAQTGDILFFGAGPAAIVSESLGALRVRIGEEHGFLTEGWRPLWVVNFPMFETVPGGKRFKASHHPFTAPCNVSISDLKANPLAVLSRSYDIVLNGHEIGGGSVRIHKADMQQAIFDLLAIPAAEAQQQFGHLLRALTHGCPPHAGIALGLDRLIMLMTGVASIREVIAFPKTQTAQCPLTGAPGIADAEQLKALGLLVKRKREDGRPQ